ncbi:germination protein YpeB [Paenalkalicoccus suaedae]|uniref:Germination protein YpeB n=1 Tax=Paenalkalicoccus suaedae TaxID=2592382 RepID=A0A859FED7_9BACI|nr:germination protein YpeB [Paenalkalicoccus suaedae]
MALIYAVIIGVQAEDARAGMAERAETGYQRAFHDLAYQVDRLHDELGTAVVSNSKDQLSPSLARVWNIATEAKDDLAQLPTRALPYHDMEAYLTDVSTFAYQHAVHDQDNKELSDESTEALESYYQKSKILQEDLRSMQSEVLQSELHFLNAAEETDEEISGGFKNIHQHLQVDESEKQVAGALDEEISKHLTGEEVTDREAVKIARKLLQRDELRPQSIEETMDGLAYSAYSLTLEEDGGTIMMDVTKVGGHPLWMIDQREIGETSFSLHEGQKTASEFAQRAGFKDVEVVASNQYENKGYYTFVPVRDDVRYYDEQVVVEVGLDTNELVAFEALPYYAHAKEAVDVKPVLSEAEAVKKLQPNVEVRETNEAVIENELGEVVRCYEFIVTSNGETYRMFINAETGQEERVEMMGKPDPIYK